MSLKEESDNEAASSQTRNSEHLKEKKISWKSNNYCANDQFQQKNTDVGTKQMQQNHIDSKHAKSGSKYAKSGSNYANSGSKYAKSASKHYPWSYEKLTQNPHAKPTFWILGNF